ncbi:hypothetical protein BDR05DRAFT_949538 [Suillus weaverae]|nr:hypothetical protein BDR05DRAFT_949538 [Suillus weaverae]
MTSSSQTANDALNATLADVQSLMRCCLKMAQGDPEALKLLDEIARHVAKDLKQYGADATSFSPKLLSCAAVVRQYSKAGTFEMVPDWTTISDADPRIKTHPRYLKTVDYRPPADDGPSGDQSCPAAVKQETDIAAVQSETATAEVQPTPTTPAVASPSPSPPTPPPAPKHNLFVPGNVKRKATKLQGLALKCKKREAKPKADLIPAIQEEASGSVGLDSDDEVVDDPFWDSNTKPANWGLDATIATPVEYSIRHHAWKCDKCKKLGMPCIVLPDKKVGLPCLVCTNCDAMKVACAIDSVGVGIQQRMLAAKAQAIKT